MSEASFCSLVFGNRHVSPIPLGHWDTTSHTMSSDFSVQVLSHLPGCVKVFLRNQIISINVNSVNSYQIYGSLNFAFHNAALLLGSWWEVMKIWHFPQTEDIFWWFQSGHVHSFSIRILSQETALELTVEVKDETWVFKNPTERSRNVQWTLNI